MSRCLIFRSNDEAAILDWGDTRKPGAGKMVHKGGDSGANDNDRQKDSKRTAAV